MDNSLIQTITIPKIFDDCTLCYIENEKHTPFNFKRVYFISNPVSGLDRGKHAHHTNVQIMFCLQGSARIMLDDGINKSEIVLDKPEKGLLINKMIWHEMKDMTEETILLVLASKHFSADDYIRDYDEFLRLTRGNENKS